MKVIQGLSTSEYATLLTDKFLTENFVSDGCTVPVVVFLLSLNSYWVIIANKYCVKKLKNAYLQFHPPKIVRPTNLMSIIPDQM